MTPIQHAKRVVVVRKRLHNAALDAWLMEGINTFMDEVEYDASDVLEAERDRCLELLQEAEENLKATVTFVAEQRKMLAAEQCTE